jgi:hypothetical protein
VKREAFLFALCALTLLAVRAYDAHRGPPLKPNFSEGSGSNLYRPSLNGKAGTIAKRAERGTLIVKFSSVVFQLRHGQVSADAAFYQSVVGKKCAMQGLNLRLPACEAGALPLS